MGHISTQRRKGTVVGYSVYLGVDPEGRKQRRFFTDYSAAEKFIRVQHADPRPVGELLDRKAELLYCLEQLRPLRVGLTDVVSFYVRHHGHKGNPTLSELVELFVAEKQRVGRSIHYAKSMRYCLNGFIPYVGKDTRVGDITREQVTNYVYRHNADMG